MSMRQVGPYLQERRKARHLTQEAVATKLGVTVRTISKWENGRETPGAELLARFIDLIQADPIYVHGMLVGVAASADAGASAAGEPAADDNAAERAWHSRLQAIEAQLDR